MIALPLPFIVLVLSLVAAVLVAWVAFGTPVPKRFFVGFAVLGAVSALLLGLRFGYGVETFRRIQPLLPLFSGPLLFLGFYALGRENMLRPSLIHLCGVPLALVASIEASGNLFLYDTAIVTSYLVYASAMVWLWWRGEATYALQPMGLAAVLPRWNLAGAGLLIAMLLLEAAIAISFSQQAPEQAVALVSVGSVIMIAGLAVVIHFLTRPPSTQPKAPVKMPSDTLTKIDDLLAETGLHLDPDLTLDRLAKRLRLPQRTVSEAINAGTGQNLSQYINGHRVAHAVTLLQESTAPVSEIMEEAGFLTRSNFYREFQRVMGQSPAEFRKSSRM